MENPAGLPGSAFPYQTQAIICFLPFNQLEIHKHNPSHKDFIFLILCWKTFLRTLPLLLHQLDHSTTCSQGPSKRFDLWGIIYLQKQCCLFLNMFPRSFMVPFSKIHDTIVIIYYPAAKSDWSDKLHTMINNTVDSYLHSPRTLESCFLSFRRFFKFFFLLTLLLWIVLLIDLLPLPPQEKCWCRNHFKLLPV